MGELAETPPSEEGRTEHVCLQAEWLETTGPEEETAFVEGEQRSLAI